MWSQTVLAIAVSVAFPHRLSISRIDAVAPLTAKIGDTLTATGEGIGQGNVDAAYLADGIHDLKVTIVEQTNTTITFTVESALRPGRYALVIRTTGSNPQLIETVVKIKLGLTTR